MYYGSDFSIFTKLDLHPRGGGGGGGGRGGGRGAKTKWKTPSPNFEEVSESITNMASIFFRGF